MRSLAALKRLAALRVLRLRRCALVDLQCLRGLMPELRELDVSDNADLYRVRNVLLAPQLHTLRLHGCPLLGTVAALQPLLRLRHLRVLTLPYTAQPPVVNALQADLPPSVHITVGGAGAGS